MFIELHSKIPFIYYQVAALRIVSTRLEHAPIVHFGDERVFV